MILQGKTCQRILDTYNELGIVKGYENNVFMPEKQVTRAEFMTMISKLLHLREEE